MDKETCEFISLCDCDEIQKRLKIVGYWQWWDKKYKEIRKQIFGKENDFRNKEFKMVFRQEFIFLPSLDHLIEMLGERFVSLIKTSDGFRCFVSGRIPYVTGIGSSRRIAVIKAVLEIAKEKNG